jgi:hypothetical protein
VITSLDQTLLMMGQLERLLGTDLPFVVAGADDGIRVIGLGLFGDRDEARRGLASMRRRSHLPAFQVWTEYLAAWLDRRRADMQPDISLGPLKINEDPEGMFQEAWLLCDVGDVERGLPLLQLAVEKGYFVQPTLEHSRHFDLLRGRPEFSRLLEHAAEGRARALDAFRDAGGERLLGIGMLAGET